MQKLRLAAREQNTTNISAENGDDNGGDNSAYY